jgi:CheY-like chemotaxis protein
LSRGSRYLRGKKAVNYKRKVLIIADDPRLAELLQFTLTKGQLDETFLETRPRHAVESVRTFMPDLILLDVEMPGLTGGEAAKLATDPDLRWIPLLFVTSLLSKAETGSRPSHHCDQLFLTKLVEPRALIGAVAEMFAEQRRVVSRL